MRIPSLILVPFFLIFATLPFGCTGVAYVSDDTRTPENFLKSVIELVRNGDLASEKYISKTFLVDLTKITTEESRSLTTNEVLGITQSFSVRANTSEISNKSQNKNPYFSIFSPTNKNFNRVIYMEELNQTKICLSQSQIFLALGPGKISTTPHASTTHFAYEFENENSITLIFQFEAHDAQCATEIALYQNRNK